MFSFLLKIFRNTVKKFKSLRPKNIISRIKPRNMIARAKKKLKLLTNPKALIKSKIPFSIGRKKETYDRDLSQDERVIRRFSPKQKELYDKAMLHAEKQAMVNEFLLNANNSVVNFDFVDLILENPRNIFDMDDKLIDDYIKQLNSDLGALLETYEDDEGVTYDELYEHARLEAYNEYIESWEDKFYESGGEMVDGVFQEFSDERKQEIWEEISQEKTFTWFVNEKINR